MAKNLCDLEPGQSASLRVPDADSLRALGRALGAQLRAGDLVFLCGDLGAGKTTLAQGVGQALGAEQVTSPTFVLIHQHDGARPPLLHLDAYRLEGLEWDDLREAGIEDLLARIDAVRLIEWPEMIEPWLGSPSWRVRLREPDDGAGREVVIERAPEAELAND